MGRANRKSGGGAIREHWTDTHPDRHLWSPGRLAIARTQTLEEYEALYGRENARVDLRESSPAARQYASEALRAFAAGRPEELLSIVRTYGLPEPGSFLENVYKRAFASHARNVFKSRFGVSLRQKDPLVESFYTRGIDEFYQKLLRSSADGSPLAAELPGGWEADLFASEGEVAENLRGNIANRPLSETNPEILRGLLRDPTVWPGALQASVRREVLQVMKQSIEGTRFWNSWDVERSVMPLSSGSKDIRILRKGSASPLLHLRHPQNSWATICGKDRLGQGAARDSWSVAGESNRYKRCSDCEKGLADLHSPEADKLRDELQNKGEYLPLYHIPEREQDSMIQAVIESREVQESLDNLKNGGELEAVSRAIFNQSAAFMCRLEEIQRREDTDRDGWARWRNKISYRMRREAGDILSEPEAMESIFTPTVRRAVWELEMRARQAFREDDYTKERKMAKAILRICNHAAEKEIERRKQKPAQTEASVSQ